MALTLEYFDAAGNAAADGVYIPVSDLPGILAAELAAAEPENTKESKILLSILNALTTALPATALGMTATKGSPSGAGADILNCPFTLTWQRLIDLAADTISPVPVPVAGANAGVGDVALVDIFPNAAKVAAAGAVAGAGVVIPTATVSAYSDLTHAALNPATDCRDWIMALVDAAATEATLRSATVASGIVTRSRGAIGSATIPATWYQAVDPVAGVAESDLPKLGLITRSVSLAVQVALNQTTQVFEVRSVTTA